MSTNFNFTDPTYLRTIYDGLLSGALHKDNASSLPVGLVGIYEEAIPAASQVKERQKFLEFFSAWSLLKKEVSASFVSQILGWPEEQVLDYIARYSKWFNSPSSGKYAIYHERLRSFILQKISHAHFTVCNDFIIKLGQEALEKRSGNEWEHYALEHLSTHLLIQAMESKDAALLKKLAYSNEHWSRQVEISKGFEWSKRMLNDMMLWASKYDDDEVIECALNKVDLYHREQNDAPSILSLIEQGFIEAALERIDSFGDDSLFGQKRKIVIYFLSLDILLEKISLGRVEDIKKVIRHFDSIVGNDIVLNRLLNGGYLIKIRDQLQALGLGVDFILNRSSEISDVITIDADNADDTDSLLDRMFSCLKGCNVNVNNYLDLVIDDQISSEKYEEILKILRELHARNDISINLYNSVVESLSILCLRHAKIDIEELINIYRIGITTKSFSFNKLLMLCVNYSIHYSKLEKLGSVIDRISDFEFKTISICNGFTAFWGAGIRNQAIKLLDRLEINENSVDIIVEYGSKYVNPGSAAMGVELMLKSLEFRLCCLECEKYEIQLRTLNYLLNNEGGSLVDDLIAELIKTIKFISNYLKIQEFKIHKMVVRLAGCLVVGNKIDKSTKILCDLYYSVNDIEDWLDMVSESFAVTGNNYKVQLQFIELINDFIYVRLTDYLASELPERRKVMLITRNAILLHLLYMSLNLMQEWETLLFKYNITELNHDENIANNKVVMSVNINDYINELIKQLPLYLNNDKIKLFTCLFELGYYSRYKIYINRNNESLSKLVSC
jgi:hypothetical protein